MEDACFVMCLRSSNLAALCYGGRKQTCPWLWRKSVGGSAGEQNVLAGRFGPYGKYNRRAFSGRPDSFGDPNKTRKRWRDWWPRERRKRLRRYWLFALRARDGIVARILGPEQMRLVAEGAPLDARLRAVSADRIWVGVSQNPTWWSVPGFIPARNASREAPCCWAAGGLGFDGCCSSLRATSCAPAAAGWSRMWTACIHRDPEIG